MEEVDDEVSTDDEGAEIEGKNRGRRADKAVWVTCIPDGIFRSLCLGI